MRRAARACLTALLLGSLAFTLWSGWQIATGWPGAALMERSQAELAAGIDRAMARHATPARLDARLEALLAQEPRNWLAVEAVGEVAAARGHAFDGELRDQRAALHAQDTGALARTGACTACMWDPQACDFSAILLCRAPVDLTPLGDIAGIARAAGDHARGREVDEVDLALSVVGLAAVTLAPFTMGSSGTLKLGAGMGKTIWRMGALSPGMVAPLRRAARDGVDWARLPGALVRRNPASATRPEVLQPVIDLALNAGRMQVVLGSRRTLYLISQADSMADARRMADAAGAMGPRALGAFEVLGKSRFLRAGMRWSAEVYAAFLGLAGLLAALAGLFWNTLATAVLRLLRRRVR